MRTALFCLLSCYLLLLLSCKKEVKMMYAAINEENILGKSGGTSNNINLTQGLVVFYPFNGNANDASGNGNNGTVNGAMLTKDRTNARNKAYFFENGATITIPHKDYLGFEKSGSFSISLFAKRTGTQNVMHLMGKRGFHAATFNWQICHQNEQRYTTASVDGTSFAFGGNFYCGNNTCYGVYTKTSLPLNSWVNIIGIYNNGYWYIYQGGVLLDTNYPSEFDADVACDLTIGNSGGYEFFTGAIDDIRIYNRALNTYEIAYLAIR
jgi:hypothetical protein